MTARADDIGRDDVIRVLNAFYPRVRRDDLLGPLFGGEIADWDAYLDKMVDYWCGVLVDGPAHAPPAPAGLLYGVTREGVARWHALMVAASADTLSAPQAARLGRLAQEVAAVQGRL